MDFGPATTREWLETNGIGGFASSTVCCLNTRRYHGLLTAALPPPLGRMLLLAKLEDTVVVDGRRFELSANQYSGAIHPRGFELLADFRLDPSPTWTYEIGSVRIVKTLTMTQSENTVRVEYQITAPDNSCSLEIRPLIAFRGFHATTHANNSLDPSVLVEDQLASVQPYSKLPRLWFAHNATALDPQGHWYYNFEYQLEKERGLDSSEDLFNPFTLRYSGTDRAVIVASTEKSATQQLKAATPTSNSLIARLTSAANQFLIHRGEFKSVIAGYHWFGEWGRDTMIALPGLTLSTGRPELAKEILLAWSGCVSEGMLPNRFPDAGGTPEYNTADATLWFFEAIRAYAHHTGDLEFVRTKLYSILKDIVIWHVRGTRYGIKVDSDGLLSAREPGVQLTWMDAKIGDWVVTPRHGKPVEIQALWYNALRTLEAFAESFNDDPVRLSARERANLARTSFNQQFWNETTGCLFDLPNDPAIRPNQIFAASLHHPILDTDKIKPMLTVVEKELLTSFGLRTLSPRDPRYRPRYEGSVSQRDSAYHQGTVWPWLLGPFITAYVRAHQASAESRRQAQIWLEQFAPHLDVAGLNQVSEILDGDPPHHPRGCIAQAWSVAEILRAALEIQS